MTHTGTGTRNFGLDLVRCCAILLVLINHSVYLLFPLRQLPYIGYALGKIFALTVPFGLVGVELFFALSGFLIGTILVRSFSQGNFSGYELLQFWKRRWMRTLPAYYVVLFLVLLLDQFLFHRAADWRYFFFLQNFITPHPDSFGEAWSLSVEEWSYLCLGLLFFVTARFRNRQPLLPWLLGIYLLCCTLLRAFNALDPLYENFDWGIRKLVLFRLDAVAWGVLMAWFQYHHPDKISSRARTLFLTGFGIVIIATGLNYSGTHPDLGWYFSNTAFRYGMDTFLFSLLPAGFALMLPYAATVQAPRSESIQQLVRYTSRLSYALYLVHHYVVLCVLELFIRTEDPVSSLLLFLDYYLLILLAALLLHLAVEQPFLRLRDRNKTANG